MKVNYCFMIVVVSDQIILAEVPLCFRKGQKVCCSGYKWNELTRTCEECPPGYRGTDCKLMCYPPYHGAGCFQVCQCPMDLCDPVSGCKMPRSTAKAVTTRYRQKDLNGDILYERTPALPTCIGMSGNKAKAVTTRFRQKDLNGETLYEGTLALPTCIGKEPEAKKTMNFPGQNSLYFTMQSLRTSDELKGYVI